LKSHWALCRTYTSGSCPSPPLAPPTYTQTQSWATVGISNAKGLNTRPSTPPPPPSPDCHSTTIQQPPHTLRLSTAALKSSRSFTTRPSTGSADKCAAQPGTQHPGPPRPSCPHTGSLPRAPPPSLRPLPAHPHLGTPVQRHKLPPPPTPHTHTCTHNLL
jgi:hypothetical protein